MIRVNIKQVRNSIKDEVVFLVFFLIDEVSFALFDSMVLSTGQTT